GRGPDHPLLGGALLLLVSQVDANGVCHAWVTFSAIQMDDAAVHVDVASRLHSHLPAGYFEIAATVQLGSLTGTDLEAPAVDDHRVRRLHFEPAALQAN